VGTANPASSGPAASGHVDEHPGRKAASQFAKPYVHGAGEVGEKGEGGIGMSGEEVVVGALVKLAHLGRDLFETRFVL